MRAPRIVTTVLLILATLLASVGSALAMDPSVPGTAIAETSEPGEPRVPVEPTRPVDPGYPVPYPWANIKVADPRAGIAGDIEANAENLMVEFHSDAESPVATVVPGSRFRIYSDYEAVIFPKAAGEARFELEVYRLIGPLPEEPGVTDSANGRVLIGADKAAVVGRGPLRRAGSLNVFGAITEPGAHQLEIIQRTMARGHSGRFVVDEDRVYLWVFVSDEIVVTPPPIEPMETPVAGVPALRAHARALPEPTRPSKDPVIVPTDQWLRVASPRGHFLSSHLAAAENFDENHGRKLIVRQGDVVTFASAYEFVWFGNAGGGGKTGLTIRLETAGVEGQVLGQDEASVKQENGLRIAGTLQAPVPFEQAGSFVVLAVIRTAVSPGEITMLDADQQQDTDIVRIEVEVIGQPEVGAIRGRVTAETDGVPLEGMILRVYQADTGRLVQYTRTGQDGTYLASGIPAGAYLVHADPQQQGYLPEWYDDAATRADADPVAVASGQTTDGVDFALSRGGVISGWVYEDDPDSTSGQPTPIANAMILVGPYVRPDGTTSPEYEGERLYKARTQRDGSYRVEGLPPGAYWVYAGDDSQSLIGEYYNDKPSREQADPVAVRAGQETENITFRLRYGGAIAGYVWGAHILPVEPIQSPEREVALLTPFKVTAYDWETGQAVRTIGVDRRGFYTIPGLPEGGYRVYAFDEAGQYIPEYYDDVTDPREATKVQVRRGATTPDINFQLSLAGVAIVQVRPPMTQVRPGDAFEIAVWAKDVTSLGGFAFDLYYDARVLSVIETSVALGDFLGSTGRTVFPLGPQFSEGLVRFGGGSLGDAAGPDGSGVLARMRFEAVTPGKSALALANTTLTDTEARPIRSQAYDGYVAVEGCIFGDLDCDCDVDILDVMQVAVRWGSKVGDPNYDARYDVDGDGDIDIADVMQVAAVWGSTCDSPRPVDQTEPGAASQSRLQATLLAAGLRLEPASVSARVGEPVTLQVWVDEAYDLGGFEFTLEYDATKLAISANDVRLGDFLGSSGRTPAQLGPKITVAGDVGTVAFGGWTMGFTPPGPSGSGVLAHVTFTPLVSGEMPIRFTRGQVTDTTAQSQEEIASRGAVFEAAPISMNHRLVVPFVLR